MPKEYSPFTPGIPVPPEQFAGKKSEVDQLFRSCKKAQSGRFERTFVIGQRGSGKTSMCQLVRDLADRELKMLAIQVFLGGASSVEEMVRRIFEGIAKASADRSWYSRLGAGFQKYIRQVGLFGVSVAFQAPPEDLKALAISLPQQLLRLLEQIEPERIGFVLILDDINGLADSQEFADWLKSFVDTVGTTRPTLKLHLILAGLPERRTSLVQLNPSLNRVFDLVHTEFLSDDEVRGFFSERFASVGITVSDDALTELVRWCAGYPMLMQEIGQAVYDIDTDGRIDHSDAFAGVASAAIQVGRKYLDDNVLRAIRSKRYRALLKNMTKQFEQEEFSRESLLGKTPPEEVAVLDNFLRKMKSLGVLEASGHGKYRFANPLHRLYYLMELSRQGSARRGASNGANE